MALGREQGRSEGCRAAASRMGARASFTQMIKASRKESPVREGLMGIITFQSLKHPIIHFTEEGLGLRAFPAGNRVLQLLCSLGSSLKAGSSPWPLSGGDGREPMGGFSRRQDSPIPGVRERERHSLWVHKVSWTQPKCDCHRQSIPKLIPSTRRSRDGSCPPSRGR